MDSKRRGTSMATAKIVQVEWIDAVADSGWEDKVKAQIDKCITVGFLIDETDEAICIASTVSIDHNNARMHIPKAWIKNRKVLGDENPVSESKGTQPAKMVSGRTTKKVSATKDRGHHQHINGSKRG